MLKTTYIVEYHTWWEHYGATPTKRSFDNKVAAQEAAALYEADFHGEDGYYADVFVESKVELTPQDLQKREQRKAESLRLPFNLREQADFGLAFLKDGRKVIYYMNNDCQYFIKSKGQYSPLDWTVVNYLKSKNPNHLFDLLDLFKEIEVPTFD